MYKPLVFLIVVIALFTNSSIYSQSFADSLNSKNYEELESIYKYYKEKNTPKAKIIANKYLLKAKKDRDTLKTAEGYFYNYEQAYDTYKFNYLDSIIAITKFKQNIDYPAKVYFRKAQFYLFEKRDIEKTLNNLNEARKYSRNNNNINLLYRIEYYLGIVRSEHLGEKEKAIETFKKCEKFYKNKTENNFEFRYLYTLHAIAETYIGLEKYDSATYYNNLGYSKVPHTGTENLKDMKYFFILCEGINQHIQQRYSASIDSIKKALPIMIKYEDISNTIDSYFYLGKSYYDLDNKKEAIIYFKKTDSILETLKSIPQYKHVKTYEYLKTYYKSQNDLVNQNKYLNKLNRVLDTYLNDQIFISRKVKEDYDIPLLLEEQKNLIKKLNKNSNTYRSGVYILILLVLTFGGLLFYQYRKKRIYRQRFEAIVSNKKTSTQTQKEEVEKAPKIQPELKVPEKHVTYILNKLNEFEQEQKYLTLGMSIQSLADDMETNIKYLSRVINHYKNKTFTNYLNELRISYAVEELKRNSTLRKFTIKAIAQEMGYNSAETFSNAFYKQVKIKPSYFVKSLNNKTQNEA